MDLMAISFFFENRIERDNNMQTLDHESQPSPMCEPCIWSSKHGVSRHCQPSPHPCANLASEVLSMEFLGTANQPSPMCEPCIFLNEHMSLIHHPAHTTTTNARSKNQPSLNKIRAFHPSHQRKRREINYLCTYNVPMVLFMIADYTMNAPSKYCSSPRTLSQILLLRSSMSNLIGWSEAVLHLEILHRRHQTLYNKHTKKC